MGCRRPALRRSPPSYGDPCTDAARSSTRPHGDPLSVRHRWGAAFCAGCLNPKSRVEEVSDTLDHVLLTHLDLDYGIGRPALAISEERALTLEEARQPRAITGFLGCTLDSE